MKMEAIAKEMNEKGNPRRKREERETRLERVASKEI